MKLAKATIQDLEVIMSVITDAQNYLADLKIDQWQNGYPDITRLALDISNNESYKVIDHKNTLIATTMFTTNTEPTYLNIDGNWLTQKNATYGVIHRMAVSNAFRKKGCAKFIFNHFETYLKNNNIASMRIDTHEDNLGMQNLLKNLGYKYCGIIYLANNDKRLAFEKRL